MNNDELKKVHADLENKDFKNAANLLKQLKTNKPNNPWVEFYIGRFYELNEKRELAEKVYRQLLQDSTNPKLVAQARQGLKRIEDFEQQKRQAAVEETKTDPSKLEPGVLILEPVSNDKKAAISQSFARILKVDPYTVRMQLQSRGWRLYKTGAIGELSVYGKELQNAGIPVFWASHAELQNINIFRVHYFQSISPQPTIVCQNALDQIGVMSFNWSEVTQRVEGLLPIFMEIMDYAPHRRKEKFRHKEITQDYAQVWDLHLPKRNSILRFCDHSYQFQEGVSFTPPSEVQPASPPPKGKITKPPSTGKVISQNTARINWNNLINNVFYENLPETSLSWSEFTPFAETALDYPNLLSRFKHYIDIERKSETPWDPAFHLYSTLVFLKSQSRGIGDR